MIKTYPEMNAEIVNLLRFTDDNPVTMYAAARIEELECVNAALQVACEAYCKDHDDDIASLCRDVGIQPSVCDCDLCEQARIALREQL